MVFFDYCSGIGGGRLGLEQCGYSCVGHADTSRLSDITYNKIFEINEKNWGNIRKIKADELPYHDIMIAGFPCQSFSIIGKREGINDKRGQLIFNLLNIAKIVKPKYMIFENVKGLVNHDKGNTLSLILEEIKKTGYFCKYKILSSLDYGVPQMRQRVYFICFREKENYENFNWPNAITCPPLSSFLLCKRKISPINLEYFIAYLNNKTNLSKYSLNDILAMEDYTIIDTRMSDLRIYLNKVPTLRSQRDGIYYLKNHELYELSGVEALLLQGFDQNKISKVENDVTNRHLLMQAGNAMTVNVIYQIGKNLR